MSEVISSYETVLVISTKLSEDETNAIIEKFKALIEKNATIDAIDKWGKRKLAYLINKESEGYYVFFAFKSNTVFPAELDRVCRITDGILRFLTIKRND